MAQMAPVRSEIAAELDPRETRLFRALDRENCGEVRVMDVLAVFRSVGLREDDRRIAETMAAMRGYALRDTLDCETFCRIVRPDIFIVEQALQGTLVVPDFQELVRALDDIHRRVQENRRGAVADYIPQLARVDAELFGAAICTVDGQRHAVGDASVAFCAQSCTKPVTYSLALEEHGEDGVHSYVGREPSGRIFNELALGEEGRPHNPMINAGAIMCTSLVRSDLDAADRFDHVLDRWSALCGGERPGFSNSVYQSERQSADRNYALGYYMREHGAFPESADLIETLEFYFQNCSIEVTAEMMSVLAATLANGGVCPVTGERVLKTSTVRHCLSLMCSCGMYDFSGEFAFQIGLPAKSGVSGALLVVVPNVMGLCVWSPRLDCHGNSVRGIAFCRELVETFNLHNYDSLTGASRKVDPRRSRIETKAEKVDQLIWAASKGDLGAVHRLAVRGFDLDGSDYDGRTPLHLAAAEGRDKVVGYLLDDGTNPSPRDRWGGTPLDDARRHGHAETISILLAAGAQAGDSSLPESRRPLSGSSGEATEGRGIVELIYAASEGDLPALQRGVARGRDLAIADYDLRTPLHLAAAEGHEEVVEYFVSHRIALMPRDRWGSTPLDDARRHGRTRVVELLERAIAAPPDLQAIAGMGKPMSRWPSSGA